MLAQLRRAIDPQRTPSLRAAPTLAVPVAVLVGVALVAAGECAAAAPAAGAAGLAVTGVLVHTHRLAAATLREVRESWGLTGVIVEGKVWPAPGGWALGADAIAALLARLDPTGAPVVLELGPGTSSIVLGRALPNARMYGLEHDPRFAEAVRRRLAQHGLPYYTLLEAPLAASPVDAATTWYDPRALDALPDRIDVLIVDGPPNLDARGRRSTAWPLLRDRMTADALVLVDDTHRRDERQMAQQWLSEDPDLTLVEDRDSFMILRRGRAG